MKKVVVGMSGGVDSSVAAYLLKISGCDVYGVTMKMFGEDSFQNNFADAQAVCDTLQIPLLKLDMTSEFQDKVINPFVSEYLTGRTPNPCIICNENVKWTGLLRAADQVGADNIATGHYAKIVGLSGRKTLQMMPDSKKDQTYMLYRLTQEMLVKTLFPCGGHLKDDIREIAEKAGIPVAQKPDSQEICFVDNDDYPSFVAERAGEQEEPGNFVDLAGNVMGRHLGISHYTVGQRKGFSIAFGKRVYIKSINPKTRDITLCDNDELFSKQVTVGAPVFMGIDRISNKMSVYGKLRYQQKPSPCSIETHGNEMFCEFDEPQRAPTPGQSAVFYQDGMLLCGGIIM